MEMRAKWELSAGAFEQLLHTLSPDRGIAGRQYETIREGLLRFFTRRVGASAEALVDETIDRVCRRIDEGEVLVRPGAYFLAVARYVLREHLKMEQRRESLAIAAIGEPREAPAAELHDDLNPMRLLCLRGCLRALPAADRALVQQYYGAAGADPVTITAMRAALARQMGVTPGALRVRVHRARQRLATCYRQCADGAPASAESDERGRVD